MEEEKIDEESAVVEEKEEPKLITKEDTLKFATEVLGLSPTSCPWTSEPVNGFVKMINHSLLNVDFAVERVNPQCLDVLVGHPMTTIEVLTEVWEKFEADVKEQKANYNNERSRIDRLKHEHRQEMNIIRNRFNVFKRDAVIGMTIWNDAWEERESSLIDSIHQVTSFVKDEESRR